MRHFVLPATPRSEPSILGPLTPAAYLRLRRVAAGYEPDAFTRAYAMVAAHDRPVQRARPDLEQSRSMHRALRDQLALLERPGATARIDGDIVLATIAKLIPFDPAVYRQLASEPADCHPRICRGCGCSDHDACVDEHSACHWITPQVCSHCVDGAVADAKVAA